MSALTHGMRTQPANPGAGQRTAPSTSSALEAALAELQRLGVSQQEIKLGRMERFDGMKKKLAMDRYKEAQRADEQSRFLAQAAEAMPAGGTGGEQAPYGAYVAASGNGDQLKIYDAAGNLLTTGLSTSVAGLQNAMQKFDIDPNSIVSALERYSVKNPQIMQDAQAAVNSYQRNPLVQFGDQFSSPASSIQNESGGYQHAIGKTYNTYSGPSGNEAALRASQSWMRTDPEWQKVQTAWLNHGKLNEGRSDLVNNGIDTSGVKFQFGGNARDGVNTGTGFANTGYESGVLGPNYTPETPQPTSTMAGFGNLFDSGQQTTQAIQTPSPTQSDNPMSGFGSMFADSGWQNKYNQSSVLPAVYQPGQTSPTNGDWGSWATNNPFKIRSF